MLLLLYAFYSPCSLLYLLHYFLLLTFALRRGLQTNVVVLVYTVCVYNYNEEL